MSILSVIFLSIITCFSKLRCSDGSTSGLNSNNYEPPAIFPGTPEEEMKERKFASWLLKNGAIINNVEIGRNSYGQRGLYSKIGHKKGDLLSITPTNLILNNVYIRDFVPYNKYLHLAENTLGGCGQLAFFLMFESAVNNFSTIQPYIDVLPKEMDLPGDWTHPTVVKAFSELPSGKLSYDEEVEERRQLLDHLKTNIFPPLLNDYNHLSGEKLLKSYLWARRIAKSRTWGTLKVNEDDDPTNVGTCTLVPYADLYNHNFNQSPLSSIMLSNALRSSGVTVGWGTTATIDYKPGEEIFISYSTSKAFTCSFKAFLAFGIIPEKDLDPKHDCFILSTNVTSFIDGKLKLNSERLKLLKHYNFEVDSNNFIDIELHGSTIDTFEEPTRSMFHDLSLFSFDSKY